jgi:hypothetical protein
MNTTLLNFEGVDHAVLSSASLVFMGSGLGFAAPE